MVIEDKREKEDQDLIILTTEEVIRRLGNPDKKTYIGYDFEKDTGPIYCYRYVTPQYTNFSGRTGSERESV